MRVYVASSWRNARHPDVIAALRSAGHQVYDYRRPAPETEGFRGWSLGGPVPPAYSIPEIIHSEGAVEAFDRNSEGLYGCDAMVLLLPSGRSAHMEAGFAKGLQKRLYVLLDDAAAPELMYGLADGVCLEMDEVLRHLIGDNRRRSYAFGVPEREPVCRACGCWQEHACPGGCEWIEDDLCSKCAEKAAVSFRG